MVLPFSDVERWKTWDDFLATQPSTGFMQSSWWANFRATVGFDYFGVTLKDHDALVGGALVQKLSYAPQQCFYYIQDGPVLPDDASVASQIFEATLKVIEQHRHAEPETVSHLRIEPRWQFLPSFVRGFHTPTGEDSYMEPRDTLCIDLRPTEEAILAQMKPKGRYNIRVAQRHGVTVVEDTSEQGLTDFLRIYKRTAIRQGIETKPPSYFRTLISTLIPLNQVALFFADYHGRRLATALVVYFGQRATYFFGGSLAQYRRVMAAYLLHFAIMRRAKALGYAWYDLWGIAPANIPDHRWQPISVFKRKFGGLELNLVPALDYVYDPVAYNHYRATEREPDAG